MMTKTDLPAQGKALEQIASEDKGNDDRRLANVSGIATALDWIASA
jgi:hypothetical protein